MTIYEIASRELFNNHPELLADGVTAAKLSEGMAGMETALSGLSEKERISIIENSKALKSHQDTMISNGIKTNEKKLKSDYDTEKRKSEETIKTLKGRIPMSADPAELRKQAETETDETKRSLLLLKADNIETKQSLEKQNAETATKDAALRRQELISLAKEKIGNRNIPKSIKIESFLGEDAEATTAMVEAFNSEWDDLTKDMKTASVTTTTPPGGGEEEVTGEDAMNEKLDNMSFLN